MPPKAKSLYRKPGTQHFQLVHRSQRDPLINDPEAGDRVLKSIDRKGKSRAEIAPEYEASVRPNEGEAAMHGIFYDDSDYDYMQHLRGVGETVDAVLLNAPSTSASASSKAPRGGEPAFKERMQLPASVLPSTSELPLKDAYSRLNAALPAELQGLQPDMDPHLRQMLEALDDDAFVADGDEDDWLGELVETGEVQDMAEVEEYEFAEWGIGDDELEEGGAHEGDGDEGGALPADAPWEDRFKAFKLSEAKARAEDAGGSEDEGGEDEDEDDRGTEGGDTVSGLPALSVIGGKRRRKGAQSDASGYSMSSSSMFRNKGLSTLDEKFDRIEKIYEEESDSDEEDPSDTEYDSNGDPIAPALVTREDFDNILDDFLDNFEIVGNKLKPSLPGVTPADRLGTFREGLGGGEGDEERERQRILDLNRAEEERGYDEESDDEKLPLPDILEDRAERGWDAETILSTYSVLENHPRLIDERSRVPRIEIDPKTGFPIVDGEGAQPRAPRGRKAKLRAARKAEPVLLEEDEDEDDEGTEDLVKRETITRPKNETAEEKRLRKAAVKEDRAARRTQKKTTQTLYSQERKTQLKQKGGLVAEGRASDLSMAPQDRVTVMKLV